MDLTELERRICSAFSGTHDELLKVMRLVEEDSAVFPFNGYEHLICGLIETRGLSYEQYIEIRTEYIAANPNLWIFEISAPRGFGEGFAQTYVHGKCPKLTKPSKKSDPNYSGEYDFSLGSIKIEVKASRAVDAESSQPLYVKALSRDTNRPFHMNFQQLKPQCCDVFIWVAVFRDEIVLWVLASADVESHPQFSKGQHRGNKGNEGQLHIDRDNIRNFEQYELGDRDLEEAIRIAAKRSAV